MPPQPVLARHELVHRDGRRLFVYGPLRGDLGAEPPGRLDTSRIHQRYDALTDTWIAVSPSRNTRPAESAAESATGRAACPLCPGGPEVPFAYDAAVFENHFPTFVADPPPVTADPLIAPSLGRCEVVLYTGRHEGSLATLRPDELAGVMAIWVDRTAELWSDPRHAFVMAFENRGAAVGATLAHPHGQIYAFDRVPPLIAQRVAALDRHRHDTGRCLTCDVIARDLSQPDRVIEQCEGFVVAVPFAPRWPYEVHIRSRRHGAGRLSDLDEKELIALSAALRAMAERYQRVLGSGSSSMMMMLEAPAEAPDWHLSFELLPPNRSRHATKIRASVETAAGTFINDTIPEEIAGELRATDVPPRSELPIPRVERRPVG